MACAIYVFVVQERQGGRWVDTSAWYDPEAAEGTARVGRNRRVVKRPEAEWLATQGVR